MLPVYAEATADRRELIVMAGGGPEVAHEHLRAARHLEGLTPLFKGCGPGALKAPLTWSAVIQLQETFSYFFNGWTLGPGLQAWLSEQAAARYGAALGTGTINYVPPAGLTPYPWQVSGAAMIAATGRALITDEPRTGKTITTILGLVEWRKRHTDRLGPVLVVCPASVVDPWVEAWQLWSPSYRAVAWRGSKRRSLLGTADVYVTSYETARIDAPVGGTKAMRPLIEGLDLGALVIDECHLAKNSKAKRTEALERIATRVTGRDGAVVALSGTPITHDPGDLHPVLKMLEPGAYPSKERWVTRYCNVLPGDYRDENLGLLSAREPEFRLSLLGQTRRVARADVMSHLPPKTYSVRTVELPKEWRKVYDDFESEMYALLPDNEQELAVFDAMSVFQHLSGLASAPADVQVTFGPDEDKHTGLPKRHVHLDLKGPSWKVKALLEVMSERPGERVVVYTPRAQLAQLAGEALIEAGYRTGYFIGETTQGERTRNRLAFQAGELDVLCCTTGAGGVGITLSAAETLVFLQRPWALVESIQAEDRAEGDPNATRGTEIIDIVASNTIESRVRAVLRERAGQLAELVQDPRIVRDLLGGTAVERRAAA